MPEIDASLSVTEVLSFTQVPRTIMQVPGVDQEQINILFLRES